MITLQLLRARWSRVRLAGDTRLASLWLGGLAAAGLLVPALSDWPGEDVAPTEASRPPSRDHPFGTDPLGRDVLARTAWATHAFFGPGLGAWALGLSLGLLLGAAGTEGLAPSHLRRLTQALRDGLAGTPALILVLVLSAGQAGSLALPLGVGLSLVPVFADLTRERLEATLRSGEARALRAHGLGPLRVGGFYGLVIGADRALLARSFEAWSQLIVLEASLSYLGRLGTAEPWPSWGNQVVSAWGRPPWTAVAAPVVALSLTLLALGRLARALEDR